jgi:beta-mannosidase
MALNWCFNEPWPTAANNSIINWPNWPKPAFYAVRDACRPVLASARNFKFTWSRGEVFSAQLWMLNDLPESLEGGVLKATLTTGKKYLKLGQWEFQGARANTNVEGPEVKVELPQWKTGPFTLLLEVEGHPEYNSEYTFLLTE